MNGLNSLSGIKALQVDVDFNLDLFKRCESYSFLKKDGWWDSNSSSFLKEVEVVVFGGLSGTLLQKRKIAVPVDVECDVCGEVTNVCLMKSLGWDCPGCLKAWNLFE